ncbi:MAG: BON domain-containing protein [Gaiellaceae bacterium]
MRTPKALIDDTQLSDAVKGELEWDPRVDEKEIHVTARDGSVALTGFVPSYAHKAAAVQAAERVHGVKAVADDLDVRLSASAERKDAEIARAIAHERDWNAWIPDTVQVDVSKGHVTLRGEVEWSYQREEAMRAVRRLAGVRDVTNLTTVRPRVEPQAVDVERQIADALVRMADLDARSIHITTDGGTVRLYGTVHSLADRRVAQLAAESAPGVTHVQNDLAVEP